MYNVSYGQVVQLTMGLLLKETSANWLWRGDVYFYVSFIKQILRIMRTKLRQKTEQGRGGGSTQNR